MSVYSNRADSSPEDIAGYVPAVLDLLGESDPRDVLSTTHAALRRVVETVPAETLATPEAEGKWSIVEVLQHMADSELVWGYRLRMVLGQERPTLTGYDQDQWAARLRYDLSDPATAVAEFGVLRAANLRLLARATESDLTRVGVHAERGEESVAHMIRLYAGHDRLHLRQIERLVSRPS